MRGEIRQQQRCKKCGARDAFNFHVPDPVWTAVVPVNLSRSVLCLACFDSFANKRDVDYHRSLRVLYFAGQQASFQFRVVRCARARSS